MPRKRHEEDMDEDEMDDKPGKGGDEDDDEDDDDEDTIDLDSAEEEEEDDDDEEDDDSVEALERKRLFQAQAEEVLETLTMDDVKEVLKENEMDVSLAPKLKRALLEVIKESEVATMDEAWAEAVERLEE